MEAADPKSISAYLIGAIRYRVVPIAGAALLSGIAAFALAFFLTPRIEAVGFVEIARTYYVDPDKGLRDEMLVSSMVLAGQINSGAFYGPDNAAVGASPAELPQVNARVPIRTDNIELTVRVDSAAEGARLIEQLVSRIAADHRVKQRPMLDRLHKRRAELQAQFDELHKTRMQLESALAGVMQDGRPRDGLQYLVLTSLQSQSNRELSELDYRRQMTVDAIDLTNERQTRLIGNVIARRASLVPCLVFGLFGALVGGLLAAAALFVRASRRALRGA